MKKKYRDIVVEGVKYGWILRDNNILEIWRNKKIIVKYTLPSHVDQITPRIVAHFISDPIEAALLVSVKPCPFCGATATIDKNGNKDNNFIIVHEDECWLHKYSKYNVTYYEPIPKEDIGKWNSRNFTF